MHEARCISKEHKRQYIFIYITLYFNILPIVIYYYNHSHINLIWYLGCQIIQPELVKLVRFTCRLACCQICRRLVHAGNLLDDGANLFTYKKKVMGAREG